MITYLLGILSVAFVPELSWAWCGILASLAASFYRPVRRACLMLACGGLVAVSYGHWQLAHRFEQPPLEIQVAAEVTDLPVYRNGYHSLMLRPLGSQPLPGVQSRLRLIKASYYNDDQAFAMGDRLEIVLRLKPVAGFSNPAAFDLERHYLSQGIDARGYIRQVIAREASTDGLPNLRQHLADYFDTEFSAASALALRALVLGDRSHLSSEQWRALQVTGTAHLFVVSGLHVAVIAALGWCMGRLLQLPALVLRWQSVFWRLLAPVTALAVAGIYAWVSGWGIPVQRAWVMLAIFMAGNWWLHPLSGWQRWRLALVVIASLYPLAILEAGLWLSFGAVALILWLWQSCADTEGFKRHLISGLKLQLILFVGMLPLMAVTFNQISLLSIAVNLVAVPVIGVLIWLLPAILAVSWMHPGMITLVDQGADWLWQFLFWCADVPGLYTELPGPLVITTVVAFIAVALLLLPMPLLYRLLVLPMLLPLLSVRDNLMPEGVFSVWLFDVGQGQAVLIETAGGALLYDTGPGYPSGGAAFPYAIQPLLDDKGIRHLETVIISHGDIDHAGGYDSLRAETSLGRIYAGQPELIDGAIHCDRQQWQWGKVRFSFQRPFIETGDISSNNSSCILSVDNGHCRLLLTGDLDASGEYKLLSGGFRDKVTWLVAGHHGSRDSTTGALLDWLRPDHVLISAGRFNRFGHPHAAVLERLESRGIPWLQTADAGAIKLVADSEQCSVITQRKLKKRYWTAS